MPAYGSRSDCSSQGCEADPGSKTCRLKERGNPPKMAAANSTDTVHQALCSPSTFQVNISFTLIS